MRKDQKTMEEIYGSFSPDAHGTGLVEGRLDPLRYNGQSDDPREVPGILRALMPERVRVLDVGCGTGSVTLVANRGKGNQVLAIEPDAQRSAVARDRGIEVLCGFLDEEFLAQKGPFDVIVFSDVLEHLPSPDDMLKLAIRGLKPGGIILASVPNVAHWSMRLNLLLGRFNYAETGLCDATHLRWFTQSNLQRLFMRQGLELLALRQRSGVFLSVYQSRYFKILPIRLRRKFINGMAKIFPRLFACQFVVKARKTQ
jgi:2-polyprenyl-3-methyl-5-hydroxy-6-metoxy-1,4-benzoquinol methylase